MKTILLLLTATVYATACVFYLGHLFERGEGALRLARRALMLAVLLHLGLIGANCADQMNPLRDLAGSLSLTAWLLAAGFLLTTVRNRFGLLGSFVVPLALVLLVVSGLAPHDPQEQAAMATARTLGRLHIALSALGVSAFGLAAAVAVAYLLQIRALKRKRLGALFRRTPPLQELDTVGRRLILTGFPLFTLAVITGVIWSARLPGQEGFRPEYLISVVTWLIFAALILLRVTVGLRGKPAALLTVLGFLATIAVLLIYMARRVVGG